MSELSYFARCMGPLSIRGNVLVVLPPWGCDQGTMALAFASLQLHGKVAWGHTYGYAVGSTRGSPMVRLWGLPIQLRLDRKATTQLCAGLAHIAYGCITRLRGYFS